MIAKMIQLFRRNPFSSAGLAANDDIICSESKQIHKFNEYQVLSYFDGMCLHDIKDISDYINDFYCKKCVDDCVLEEMAIHCERKKMLLYSENDHEEQQINGSEATLEDAPLFALISIRLLMVNGISHNKTAIETEEKQLNKYIKDAKSVLEMNEIVFYKSYQTLANDDIFLMIHTNNWLTIKKILYHIRHCYNNNRSIHQYFQTYSILGYNKKIVNEMISVNSVSSQKNITIDYYYNMGIQVQLIPGIDLFKARLVIQKYLQNNAEYMITNITGNYDLEIRGNISLREYATCLLDNSIFGWNSPISLRTSTQIYFLDEKICLPKDTDTKSRSYYYDKMDLATEWLKKRLKENNDRKFKYNDARINKILAENMLSVYRNCCQQLVRPKVWNTFQDIQDVIQRYFKLVDIEIDHIISPDKTNNGNVNIAFDHRREYLENSMHYMLKVFTILTNERLSLDFPSYEKIGNTIYEKGAYEELIQCWVKWLQMLESIAYEMDCRSNKEDCIDIDQRADWKKDVFQKDKLKNINVFHITFVIVPHQYSQTETSLQLQYRHDKKRVVVVNISLREMVRFKEMLSTLAHEVGHYAGITLRKQRQLVFLSCVNAYTTNRLMYQLTSSNKSNDDIFMIQANLYFQVELRKSLLNQIKGNPEAVYLSTCGKYVHESWVSLLNNERVENDKHLRERYYDMLTNYSLTGSIEAMSLSGIKNIIKSCEQGIIFFRSLLRELNADLFMIMLLDMTLSDYLLIIGDQSNRYSHIPEVKIQDGLNDDIWTSLYVRIICIIYVFYSSPSERNIQEPISFLNIIKKSLPTQKIDGIYLKDDILIKNMHQMLTLLVKLIDDSETMMSNDNTYWLNLLSCIQVYIIPYLKDTQEEFRTVKQNNLSLENRLNEVKDFYHKFHNSFDNISSDIDNNTRNAESLHDLSQLLTLLKDTDLLHES